MQSLFDIMSFQWHEIIVSIQFPLQFGLQPSGQDPAGKNTSSLTLVQRSDSIGNLSNLNSPLFVTGYILYNDMTGFSHVDSN